jgi:tetratricopeptide (TPR) repeat protein
MLAEVSNEPERAVRAFDELFAEDAGDAVAESCVARFASLLASAGRTREQADLWERIGHCRGLSGDGARAAEAWSRAASLREDLEDSGRAVAAHSAAAALGSDAAIAALGRLHVAAGRWLDAAQSLEWLFQGLTGERRLECGLTVADAYARAGEVQLARCRLVELVAAEPDAWSPRARLLELYRDGEAWKPLAELLADAARLAPGRESRLELLKEAIHIRLRRLRDPEGAAALAAVALGVDPQSMATRLELGEALVASGRHDESVTVLREGLTGAGGSKQDAQLHRAIAVALLGAGRRKEALVELEAAARLHPAEPGTLHALGRVAFDEGNLDLAEATLRGLVLVLHHGAPAGCEGPSRAQVYLDLSRIAELRGDPVRARDLAESAFDSALESPDEAARLERTLEERGSHGLLALVLERRLRSGADLETTAQALDALVTLWEGPLGRAADMATVIARHAGLVAREAEATRNVGRSVWAAHVRACAAVGGEAARVEAVKRYIVQLARAAEALDGDEATSVLLEMARQYQNGLGQFEGAAAIAEGLFEKDPTRVDVWLLLRDLYGHLGKPERLVDLAETMLWSTQSSAAQKQLRLDLARALLESPAKADLAIATLEGILEDEPNDSEARDALAGVLEREGRHEELAAVLAAGLGLLDGAGRRGASMWLGRVVENPQFRDRLLTTFEEDGRQDEALEVLGRALLRDPSDVDLLRRRAWIYQAIGRLDDAISDLEQAYTADRGLADDLVAVLAEAAPGEGGRRSLELIDLLLALDRASDARSAVEALLERMPRHVGGMERLASFAAADGDSVLVLQIYRELLPLLKEDPAALVRVSLAFAAVCDDQGERADVTEALEHAYRLVPANDELRNRLASVRARALAKLGRLDEAEAVLLELCKMPRGQGAVLVSSVHLELARLYLSRDDLVEAFDCLKRAFSANEKNDEASLLLGLVAIDLDDDRTALRALRAASSSRSVLAPESKAIAQQQLARIARGAGDAKRASVAPGTRDAKRLS